MSILTSTGMRLVVVLFGVLVWEEEREGGPVKQTKRNKINAALTKTKRNTRDVIMEWKTHSNQVFGVQVPFRIKSVLLYLVECGTEGTSFW